VDTDFVGTGLHTSSQTARGSVRTARQGGLRLFMEYDTLVETADGCRGRGPDGRPVAELRSVLTEDWLPNTFDVVQVTAA